MRLASASNLAVSSLAGVLVMTRYPNSIALTTLLVTSLATLGAARPAEALNAESSRPSSIELSWRRLSRTR